jgi:hypothetical protein
MIGIYFKAMSLQAIVRDKKRFSNTLDVVVNERVLGFLGSFDLKAFGCYNKLYRNLIIAYRGMNYVRAQNLGVDNQAIFVSKQGETRA